MATAALIKLWQVHWNSVDFSLHKTLSLCLLAHTFTHRFKTHVDTKPISAADWICATLFNLNKLPFQDQTQSIFEVSEALCKRSAVVVPQLSKAHTVWSPCLSSCCVLCFPQSLQTNQSYFQQCNFFLLLHVLCYFWLFWSCFIRLSTSMYC